MNLQIQLLSFQKLEILNANDKLKIDFVMEMHEIKFNIN